MTILIVIYLWIWVASFVAIMHIEDERNFKIMAYSAASAALWPIFLPAKIIVSIMES